MKPLERHFAHGLCLAAWELMGQAIEEKAFSPDVDVVGSLIGQGSFKIAAKSAWYLIEKHRIPKDTIDYTAQRVMITIFGSLTLACITALFTQRSWRGWMVDWALCVGSLGGRVYIENTMEGAEKSNHLNLLKLIHFTGAIALTRSRNEAFPCAPYCAHQLMYAAFTSSPALSLLGEGVKEKAKAHPQITGLVAIVLSSLVIQGICGRGVVSFSYPGLIVSAASTYAAKFLFLDKRSPLYESGKA